MKILKLVIFFVFVHGFAIAQVERPEGEEVSPEQIMEIKEKINNQRANPANKPAAKQPTRPTPNKPSAPRGSMPKKTGSSGAFVVKHEKRDKMREFTVGDKVVIRDKDNRKANGKIAKIAENEIQVADSVFEVKKVEKIGDTFGKVLKQKSSGTGLIIGGIAVTAGGTFVGYASTLVFAFGGPYIIVTAAGITAALGINIVGISIVKEGVVLNAKKNHFKLGKKWKVEK